MGYEKEKKKKMDYIGDRYTPWKLSTPRGLLQRWRLSLLITKEIRKVASRDSRRYRRFSFRQRGPYRDVVCKCNTINKNARANSSRYSLKSI